MRNDSRGEAARRQFDCQLIRAVEAGATIVTNDRDWASIRRAARAQAAKNARVRRRGKRST